MTTVLESIRIQAACREFNLGNRIGQVEQYTSNHIPDMQRDLRKLLASRVQPERVHSVRAHLKRAESGVDEALLWEYVIDAMKHVDEHVEKTSIIHIASFLHNSRLLEEPNFAHLLPEIEQRDRARGLLLSEIADAATKEVVHLFVRGPNQARVCDIIRSTYLYVLATLEGGGRDTNRRCA